MTAISDRRLLALSAFFACMMELCALFLASTDRHWLTHSKRDALLDSSKFVEAEIVQMPEQAHLVEEKKVAAPSPKEAAISKRVGVGRKAKPGENTVTDQNVTQAAPPIPASHGPVVISSPSPKIPSYLQDRNLKASVVIDFAIAADGSSSPRLVGSSGNEELDALAIASAKRWQFRPAEKDHQAIYSKIRLRINFEVN